MKSETDPWIFGWDTQPGIVSVWANSQGKAIIWSKRNNTLSHQSVRFTPWLYARHLKDLPDRLKVSITECPGLEPGLNYLLKSPRARELEQSILKGASKRLGYKPTRLSELNDYYRVPPVEQFLSQTGKTYFKDLSFADLHRLQFDLETTGLSGQNSRIFMVAIKDSLGFETVLEAKTPSQEATLIDNLCQLIQERDPDVIENHNLMGFDLPFLEARAKQHGIALKLGRAPGPLNLKRLLGRRQRYSLAGRELLDTLDATWRFDFVVRKLESHGLKHVAQFFGLASPDRVYIPGHLIYKHYQSEPENVKKYALDDVREVDALSKRLHLPAFALAQMAPIRFERAAVAGTATGILEPMLIRAYLHAGRGLPISQSVSADTPHEGGDVQLFATGLAHNVVKADVASLYPSIISSRNIGPKSDELGVFVHIIKRLTQLRLEQKHLAANLPKDSLEQAEANAFQAAMKLVINSGYGYLGAGEMAWFADRHAADAITKEGRKILKQVYEGIAAKGAILIEADTDGVYFAVPKDWSEQDERKLIATVAAGLSKGVHLECDGRFKAMFSHEVKNYALLDYTGHVTVRGAALHSKRMEPFAKTWLKQALSYLLKQQLEEIKQSYFEILDRIHKGDLSLEDLAISAKITKTPEAYATSQRKEAVYEAMLNAQQTQWTTGKRIKIFRADKGNWHLLDHAPNKGYDKTHYAKVLYACATRLRKAFSEESFEHMFRSNAQPGLFDTFFEGYRLKEIT